MTSMNRSVTRLTAVAFALVPALAQAQGNASAAATAMGGNYTAVARNFNAVAWNPANLGLPGNSRFSIAISPQVGLGTGPITLQDANDYAGIIVPQTVREAWLQKVIDNGGQNLGGDVNVTPLAFSVGRFAFSATTTVRADGDLPPEMVELLLFGNAGRTGLPQDYTLTDLRLDANATTTFGLSYGRRVPLVPVGDLAIGVTGKYMIGHGAASMRDDGSTITSNPLQIIIDAPVVLTDTAETFNAGTGFGFDVGATWQVGNLRASAVVHDIVSTFAWNTDNLYYLPVRATFDQDSSTSTVEDILPLSSAPQAVQDALRDRIVQSKVNPMLSLGVAWTGFKRVTLAADLRQRFGEGIELGPKTQVGLGAELRLIPFVPLRAGITTLGDGMRYSGGFGLEFGVFNLQAAAMLMAAEGRNDTGFGLTMSFGGR
ncbi:MAG: DUF5723 family protein [Gemmatimonadetes bacterium]|nr:DUF5723 family protein [Gemmatimonadota bacterium]